MSQIAKYHIADGMRFVRDSFGVDPSRAMRQLGLPVDFLGAGETPVTGDMYYDLFEALAEEPGALDMPFRMARMVVEQGIDSSVYAFYASPTVRAGLERKALFKPLLMPIHMTVTDYNHHVALSLTSSLPHRRLPMTIGWFLLYYFVMAIRDASGVQVNPAAIESETRAPGDQDAEAFFGAAVTQGSGYRLILRSEDAALPLITRNDALWASVQRDVESRFRRAIPEQSTAARVRQALVDGLPGGQSTADQIARQLALSKRSLQRKLNEEGLSYKDVLEDTRRALSLNYLQHTDMSVQEIAFLLGFRDPSSFFRAFRSWTGKTPQSVRMEAA